MRKGINTWSFRDHSLPEIFALAADAGFEGVEVALDEEGEIGLSSSEADLLRIRRQAADCGIALYSVATGLYWTYSLTDDNPVMRSKAESIVKKQLEVAAALGCDTILVIPGAVRVEFSPQIGIVDYETAYDRSLEAMCRLKREAEAARVSIGLENVWNRFLVSPIEMREFIDKVGSPYVGAYFDVGNVLFNGEPEHWIRALGGRIKKVHFKDYRIGAGTFVDLLAGDVNYPDVMKAFREVGYDGWVSAEMSTYRYESDTLIYNTSRAMDAILNEVKG